MSTINIFEKGATPAGSDGDLQTKSGSGLAALAQSTFVLASAVGANDGVASLNSSGQVPSGQLPSYVDDVLEFADLASFPVTGESEKIYVAIDTRLTYRWSGSAYVQIGGGLLTPWVENINAAEYSILNFNTAYAAKGEAASIRNEDASHFISVSDSGVQIEGLNWPTSDGTKDQVLSTDGSGNLSFVDAATGGGSQSPWTADIVSAGFRIMDDETTPVVSFDPSLRILYAGDGQQSVFYGSWELSAGGTGSLNWSTRQLYDGDGMPRLNWEGAIKIHGISYPDDITIDDDNKFIQYNHAATAFELVALSPQTPWESDIDGGGFNLSNTPSIGGSHSTHTLHIYPGGEFAANGPGLLYFNSTGFSLPTTGDDGKVLTYDETGDQMIWQVPPGLANPLTEDLDANEYDINNVTTLTVNNINGISGGGGINISHAVASISVGAGNANYVAIDTNTFTVSYSSTTKFQAGGNGIAFFSASQASQQSAPSDATTGVSGSTDTSLETAYNDLAGKFNDLIDKLQAYGLLS